MANTTMVFCANGLHFGLKTITDWVASSWSCCLNQLPSVNNLTKVWFVFSFKKFKYAEWVLKSSWYIESMMVLLKIWTPLFDTSCERVYEMTIWVCFPNIPHKIWIMKGFKRLGNSIGTFMDVDMSFLSIGKMFVTHILFSINRRRGLEEEIKDLKCRYK